ncbi:hypothetical protein Q3G72_025376 [Acer saccharum]|nr:hypothetical protein Q3G72_025376 [Acer saccharum]
MEDVGKVTLIPPYKSFLKTRMPRVLNKNEGHLRLNAGIRQVYYERDGRRRTKRISVIRRGIGFAVVMTRVPLGTLVVLKMDQSSSFVTSYNHAGPVGVRSWNQFQLNVLTERAVNS